MNIAAKQIKWNGVEGLNWVSVWLSSAFSDQKICASSGLQSVWGFVDSSFVESNSDLVFQFCLSCLVFFFFFGTTTFHNGRKNRHLQIYLAGEVRSHLLIFGGWAIRILWSCNLVDWQQLTMPFSAPNQKTFSKSNAIYVRRTQTASEVEMHSATKR